MSVKKKKKKNGEKREFFKDFSLNLPSLSHEDLEIRYH